MRDRRRAYTIIPVMIVFLVSLILSQSCASRWKTVHPYQGKPRYRSQITTTVKKMGYTIQVGAFNRVDNAVRLTRSLEGEGLNAFYFPHKSGLYKVRFGNFTSLSNARAEADRLKNLGIIDVFYIVNPSEYSVSKDSMLAQGGEALRNDLVRTARNYIGVPYQWGSCTLNGPVDCSGLVLAVYELNGLNVPRTSEEQYQYGIPIDRDKLRKGDLLFFSTNGSGKVNHVGIFIGDGRFIHAPGKGKTICEESLSRTYFSERYIGACTYLR